MRLKQMKEMELLRRAKEPERERELASQGPGTWRMSAKEGRVHWWESLLDNSWALNLTKDVLPTALLLSHAKTGQGIMSTPLSSVDISTET